MPRNYTVEHETLTLDIGNAALSVPGHSSMTSYKLPMIDTDLDKQLVSGKATLELKRVADLEFKR